MPIVCLIIVTKQRVFVKRCMEVLFILININRVGKENMKLWITFEFDTDKETLLKGKSKKEIVAFVENECNDEVFSGVIKLIKIQDARCDVEEKSNGKNKFYRRFDLRLRKEMKLVKKGKCISGDIVVSKEFGVDAVVNLIGLSVSKCNSLGYKVYRKHPKIITGSSSSDNPQDKNIPWFRSKKKIGNLL